MPISGAKFRRQCVIEPYIVDFVCIDKKLVVELDGSQHAEKIEDDAARTRILRQQGYTVLRFWNNDVLNQCDTVLEKIHGHL